MSGAVETTADPGRKTGHLGGRRTLLLGVGLLVLGLNLLGFFGTQTVRHTCLELASAKTEGRITDLRYYEKYHNQLFVDYQYDWEGTTQQGTSTLQVEELGRLKVADPVPIEVALWRPTWSRVAGTGQAWWLTLLVLGSPTLGVALAIVGLRRRSDRR